MTKIDKDSVNEFGVILHEDIKGWELLSSKGEKELISTAFNEAKFLPTGMTSFQIKNFVLSDQNFPTPDSKFWQCRLEMWSRMQSVMSSYFLFRKTQAELEIQEGELEVWSAKPDCNEKVRNGNIRLKEVEIQEKEFQLFTIGKSTAEALREMSVYRDEFEELKKHIKHNPDDKETQEFEFWFNKAKTDPKLKIMITKKVESEGLKELERLLTKEF